MRNCRVGIDLISEKGTPGGIHTYSNRLIEAMARALELSGEQCIELIVFQNDDYQWLFPAELHPAIHLVKSGRYGLGSSARRVLQQILVPRLARRAGIQLLHSVNNVLPLWAGTPAVVTVHDLSPFVVPGRFSFTKQAFLRWAVPRSVRRARRVVTVSNATRADILRCVKGSDPARIEVVPNAAGPPFSPQRDAARELEIRERYRLPERFILTVAAPEPGKNFPGIAAALSILRSSHGFSPPWVLAGTGPPLGPLVGPAGTAILDQVHALGVVPAEDLVHLYRMASVFLFPSLYEGFGLPVLEALACGTPTITSNDSALSEVAGRAALRVDPRRPETMARAIQRLWERPTLRALLARRGPKQASRFSWDEAARLTLKVYRAVCQEVEG